MQSVVNCTTFDPANEVDNAFLAAMKLLGVELNKTVDKNTAAVIDGKRFRRIAEKVQKSEFGRAMDPAVTAENGLKLFRTEGLITQELLLMQSVIGPIGVPATEAAYPPVGTQDG